MITFYIIPMVMLHINVPMDGRVRTPWAYPCRYATGSNTHFELSIMYIVYIYNYNTYNIST